MVVKDKVLPDGSVKTKRRLILDSKESGVTAGSALPQRILLPDLSDLVQDLVELSLSSKDPPHTAIADFVDAFFTIGLRPEERQYFVGKLRGVYFVFLVLAMGSRSAPLVWCRFAALLARLTQAIFRADELRLHIYVDDPAIALGGAWLSNDGISQWCLRCGSH